MSNVDPRFLPNKNPSQALGLKGLAALMSAQTPEQLQRLQESGITGALGGALGAGSVPPPPAVVTPQKGTLEMFQEHRAFTPPVEEDDMRGLELALAERMKRRPTSAATQLLEQATQLHRPQVHQPAPVENIQQLIDQAMIAFVNGPEFRKRVRQEAISILTDALNKKRVSS